METTRHFTATTYVVESGAVPLHEHPGLEMWLPPGGHLKRDELPHVAAKREVREELGLDVDLVASVDDVESDTVTSLPEPQHVQLADVNVTDEGVGHQHVDLIYYARAPHRDLDPADGEAPADAWRWFDRDALAPGGDGLPEDCDGLADDVREVARRAIERVV